MTEPEQVILLTYDEAVSLLSDGERIHTFLDGGMVLIGADWDREDVLALLRDTDRREVTGPAAQSMGHGLAAYRDGEPVFVQARQREARKAGAMTPAEELRRAGARLREMTAAAKEATHPGHGEWQPWHVIQDTKWEDFPEPVPIPDDGPFGTGGTILAAGHNVPTCEAFVAHERYAHDQEEDWFEPEFFAGPMPEGLTRFIAAMGPDFAELIADWLEQCAGWIQEAVIWETPECVHADAPCGCGPMVPGWYHDQCGGYIGDGCACFDGGLAVARAFLGASPEQAAGEGP